MAWPRVLVVGGSIGGLTVALLLRDLGCDVAIHERADTDLEDRGAGIVVLPVTERYFDRHAVGGERVSLELTYWSYVDGNGTVISADADHFRFSGWSTIYRSLLEEFGRDDYHFAHEVVGFERTADGVRIEIANGGRDEGDLLVFADGMGSTGRSLLLPGVAPEYAGYVAWRGTVPEISLSRSTSELVADAMVYQVLDPGHVLVYAIPSKTGARTPPTPRYQLRVVPQLPTGRAVRSPHDRRAGSSATRNDAPRIHPPRAHRGDACRCRRSAGSTTRRDRPGL